MHVFLLFKVEVYLFIGQVYILSKAGVWELVSLAQHIILNEGKTEILEPCKSN